MKTNNILWTALILLIVIGSVYNLVHCDHSMSCLDNQTCCQFSSGKWGCCPFPSAQCCEDRKTCCPKSKLCTPKGLNGRSTCTDSKSDDEGMLL